jgi:elongation factor G
VSLQVEPWREQLHPIIEVPEKPHVPKAIAATIRESLTSAITSGALCGYPMVNVKVVVKDYSFDSQAVDDVVYRVAAASALRVALEKAAPVMMEPIMKVEVTLPSESSGPIVADVNGRRGNVVGLSSRHHLQVVDAMIPLAGLFGYETDIRSLSQGRASSTIQFDHYEILPKSLQDKILGLV